MVMLRKSSLGPFGRNLRSAACAALLIVVAMASLNGCSKEDETQSSTSSEQATSTSSSSAGAETAVAVGGWCAATLVDGSTVFGRHLVSGVSEAFVLADAFFIANGDTADVNTLRPFGTEIHRPQPVLMIPWSAVIYEEPLAEGAAALTAIADYQAANPTTPAVAPDLSTGDVSSVFLRTGEVFFGYLTVQNGVATLQDVHFLRFKDEIAADSGNITSLDQIELVPQAQTPVGSNGVMYIPLDTVLYVQPLAADSPVVEALAAQ